MVFWNIDTSPFCQKILIPQTRHHDKKFRCNRASRFLVLFFPLSGWKGLMSMTLSWGQWRARLGGWFLVFFRLRRLGKIWVSTLFCLRPKCRAFLQILHPTSSNQLLKSCFFCNYQRQGLKASIMSFWSSNMDFFQLGDFNNNIKMLPKVGRVV